MPARPDDAFLRELRATFRAEAREHLQAIGAGLVALEAAGDDEPQAAAIEGVFRAAHSMKGAARAVDLREVEAQCETLENLFARWKRVERVASPSDLDKAHRALDALTAALQAGESLAGAPEAAAPAGAGAADTVRVAVAKLDARLAKAEEMLAVKLAAARRVEELAQLGAWFESWRREWQRVAARAPALRHAVAGGHAPGDGGDMAELLDFVEFNHEHVRRLESTLGAMSIAARRDCHSVGQRVDDLLEESKKLLLTPFGTVTASLPKLVRDLCRELGKQADMTIRGADVEIDRRVLEEVKDPLVHMLRNSIDHGIETPEQRAAAAKPPRAAITLTAARMEGGKVSIVLSDDGRGIDPVKLREQALAQRLLTPQEEDVLDDEAALDLVFRTGLSTSPAVTPLSGRGLGLAIVRENIEKLGGAVTVESEPGRGTRIVMQVPTALATFRGVLVEVAEALFVLPSTQLERIVRVAPASVRTVEGRETFTLGNRTVPLVTLAAALEMPATPRSDATPLPVAVLGTAEQRVGFVVDAVHEELEVLVKPLAPPLTRVRNVAAATVLASGRIAPILHVPDLLLSARRAAGARAGAPAPASAGPAAKSVLVAEDSITSRMLLKGILESAGYAVKTAVDGMEAFALLRSQRFDLVVSDVDMPRLNGIGLAARIRADARLASLPIILVTTLDSREDRERGMDVGANAYIVKSRFDQSDLLDAVRRLTR